MYIFTIQFVKQEEGTPGYIHMYNTACTTANITQTITVKISLATLLPVMDVPPYDLYSTFLGVDTKYENVLTAFVELDVNREMTGNLILLGYCEEAIEAGQCIKLTL
jgi:hypothetical protein